MKRFINFLKWCWMKSDAVVRTITCYVIFVPVATIIASFWVNIPAGILFSLVILGAFVTFLLFALIFGIYQCVKDVWSRYNDENPQDDVKIINRLKGKL